MVEWWLNGDFMGFWMGYYPLVVTHIANWNITMLLMGELSISMAIFNGYVKLPEGSDNNGIKMV